MSKDDDITNDINTAIVGESPPDAPKSLVSGFFSKNFSPEQILELENSTGFLFEDIERIASFSADNDVVEGFRPISEAAIGHLKNGAAGKGMDIKGKSSDQGVLNGLISLNQAFSKCGTLNDEDNINKYNEINQAKFNQDKDRIDDLCSRKDPENIEQEELTGIITTVPVMHDGKEVYGVLKGKFAAVDDNEKMIFVTKGDDGKLFNTNNGQEYNLTNEQTTEPLQALAYRNLTVEDGKLVEWQPQIITPDADQLVMGTKIAVDGGIFNSKEGAKYSPPDFSTNVGHAVTAALRAETAGNNLISHGQEIYNPHPEKWSDGAAHVFFIPSGESGKLGNRTDVDIEIVRSESEAIALFNRKGKEGYNMPVNPEWGWRVNKENELEIAPERGLSEDRYNALINIKKEHGADSGKYKDAVDIDNLMQHINKQNVRPYDQDLQQVIADNSKILSILEKEFKDKHSEPSPTELARDKKTGRANIADKSIALETKEEKNIGQKMEISSSTNENQKPQNNFSLDLLKELNSIKSGLSKETIQQEANNEVRVGVKDLGQER